MDIAFELIKWYQQNKRNLPWRNTTDPYLIWLSEIILQQTRVAQGLPYYLKFVKQYPDVKSFANASEDEILKLWQGLGYYSRGRNMLYTAKLVVEKFNGEFPSTYDDLIVLKGIGQYTASAISSFSCNEPKAVVDGNVYRVLSRIFDVETPINSNSGIKEFQLLANGIIDKRKAGLFNQAIMEFGAIYCVPKNPSCEVCIFNNICLAFNLKKVNQLPVKLKKMKVKERFFIYLILQKNDHMYIQRRDNKDIWAGLYDFPLVETPNELSIHDLYQNSVFKSWFRSNTILTKIGTSVKHLLTHQKIMAQFILVENFDTEFLDKNWIIVPKNQLDMYAKPKLIFDFLKNYLP